MNRLDEVIGAFKAKRACPKTSRNTSTDGETLRLHGNPIAAWKEDGLWITTSGWPTSTTVERLRAISPSQVYFHGKRLHLGNRPWNGEWTRVADTEGEPVPFVREDDAAAHRYPFKEIARP